MFLLLQLYHQHSIAIRKVLKLSPRYFGSFQIIQHIDLVACKLALPKGSCVHPVFHVSCLKKKVGNNVHTQTMLPVVTDEGVLQAHPEAILDLRVSKQGNKAMTVILVQWSSASADDATWKRFDDVQTRFPAACLEDKVCGRGGD